MIDVAAWRIHAERARDLCLKWHTGTDRNGRPAYEHPLEVARRVLEETGSWAAYCSACLHDTLEDTDMPISELTPFPPEVGVAVIALTRWPDESANSYFRRVLEVVLACLVKIHDIEHNFSPGRADTKILEKRSMYEGWHEQLCSRVRVRRRFSPAPALQCARADA